MYIKWAYPDIAIHEIYSGYSGLRFESDIIANTIISLIYQHLWFSHSLRTQVGVPAFQFPLCVHVRLSLPSNS